MYVKEEKVDMVILMYLEEILVFDVSPKITFFSTWYKMYICDTTIKYLYIIGPVIFLGHFGAHVFADD